MEDSLDSAKVGRRRIIDVHTHCFVKREHSPEVARDLEALRSLGVEHLVTVGLVNQSLSAHDAWRLVPGVAENRGDERLDEADDLLGVVAATGSSILPFVDTRLLTGDVPACLKSCLERGFRGVKGIYLVDAENDIGADPGPEVLGIGVEAYRKREWELFAFADVHDLPVVYHMDARRHGDAMEALLQDFPRVRVDFAHLGIGRKAFARILERHENAFTDLASMLPHVRRDPAGYREFILRYPDRVCFGSDAFLYSLPLVAEYVRMLEELGLPEEVVDRVCWENPVRFLGRALPGAEG